MLRFCGVGWVGLAVSKGGKRASMVALPQPAANESIYGDGSELAVRGDGGSAGLGGVGWAGASGKLRKRSEAECSASVGSFPLNSAYRLRGMNA